MGEITCPHPDCENTDQSFDTERAMKIHHSTKHNESLAKKQTTCSINGCTNTFEYYPSDKEGDLCKKCTKERNHHLTDEDIEYFDVICACCTNENTITESRFKTYDIYFCGKDCRNTYYRNRSTIKCENCGTTKSVQAWEIEKGRKYCDRSCYNKDNKNPNNEFNNNYYGESFEDVREIVRGRDNHKCQICGRSKKDLEDHPSAHHITPARWFFNHDEFCIDDANYPENLVLLCRHHHTLVEYNKMDLRAELDNDLIEKLELKPPSN